MNVFRIFRLKEWLYLQILLLEVNLFSNKELLTTETELKAIASAAYTGFNKIQNVGYSAPAAIGIPKQL